MEFREPTYPGLTINSRGRYKCNFCDHTTYKTIGGAVAHLDQHHPHEKALALKDVEIERLKNRPPKIEVREKIVYRDPPAPKKEEKKFWSVPGLYCSNCKTAQRGGGIPIGQTVEDTPHSVCGTRSLMLILNGDFM